MSRLTQIIQSSAVPVTVASLTRDLQALCIEAGDTLIVHSSLSSIGYVNGGPVAVILALENVLGPSGTLVMPTHSTDLTDTQDWRDPAVPSKWHDHIREHMPAFRPDLTPTRGMGLIAECFRKQDGTVRSNHPHVSWAAWSVHRNQVTEAHLLSMGHGETSPLARLYNLDARVLLLGVGFSACTCFHLAEYRTTLAMQKKCSYGAPVCHGDHVAWSNYEDIRWNDEDFPDIGRSFEQEAEDIRRGLVGQAECRLFSLRRAVDFAVQWMDANRTL